MMDITNGVKFDRSIKEGIVFNGFDTREYDMHLIERSAPTPQEKEIIESVPFAHGVYDFSNILGERIFDNRSISYTFQIYEHDYDRRKHEQTVLENKLLGTHITRLEDTYDSNYYYLGKCVSVNTTDDHVYNRLIIVVEFDCYPFKISKLPEGHDIWDEFNFELDVAQDIAFDIPRTTFKPLSVGQNVSVGAWSTQYEGGEGIPRHIRGNSYRIGQVEPTDWGASKRRYYLEGLNKWVVEQDIAQAQEGGKHVVLFNPGMTSINPTMKVTRGSTDGVTILMGNSSYNMWAGTVKDEVFRLMPGENELFITANNATIEFDFYKELI